ncbi:MAG: pseudaminic acid synthase [Dehalococcoidales bacterium]|nr:pseudaminic acid synthase [Dehalococcoidales bacterium]
MSYIEIEGRKVGDGFPVYVVAELSANHNQKYEESVKLIHSAKEAGADAVKLQTYTPDTITIKSDRPEFRIRGGTPWDGRTLHDLYSEAFMPWEWQPKLKKVANGLGLALFSSPFDKTAVDFLEKMNVPAYKIASFEIVDIPLIEYIAAKGKPIIMSTGMAALDEIKEAVKAAKKAGASQIILLKCNSAYPAPPEEMNLKTITDLMKKFGVPVGLSDHTLGAITPVAAISLGACMIEKHLTLSRATRGPDSSFSLEPQEFKEMVDAVRLAEKELGKVSYDTGSEQAKSLKFRRSLFAVRDIKAGETFTGENIRSIRPADGLHPRHLKQVLGRRAAINIERGTPLRRDMIS